MGGNLYRTLWRWHFYAGLAIIPFVLMLSATGAMFLFKPQLDRWEEQAFRNLPAMTQVAPSRQRAAALAAYPGATLHSFRLPEQAGDAAMAHLMLADGTMEDVFVSPAGQVMGAISPDGRLSGIVQRLHGQLLAGRIGGWLVEAAGSWAIVLVVTGLYLWWPRGRGLAGVLWPRLGPGRRVAWRDLHAVAGFWVSGLALVLLITALPWSGVWGAAFKAVREEAGWMKGKQDWTIGGRPAAPDDPHAQHDHAAMAGMGHPGAQGRAEGDDRAFDAVVARALSEHLAFPVLVAPPSARQADWIVRSEAQNRPLRMTLHYEATSGRPVSRETFADKHPIDRAVGYGIAWHEGQLLGLANQLIGLATALAMLVLAITGFLQWRRRKPERGLGAPPAPDGRVAVGAMATLLVAALLLPMVAVSLLVVTAGEAAARRLVPGDARWLRG